MTNKQILVLILALFIHFSLSAQSYSPRQIELAERLDSLSENAAPEIAYIQTSKDIYETGEDLWFKVYLLDAQPDFRNTLIWEPSLITDNKGEATLTFYCSDIYTDFIGRIEGVGGDGLLGSQYFNFTVRKLKP